ncbi:TPA: replication regulatory protein RepA [Yersinia enterocolitica]|nr:replication regulatory protein RepA [Yersinia enterocolitica]HDL6985317.1 replication regulatory protein RepA [Yersinia enterocolitica]HDL7067857.1 replication regulatory protein RepA [Yersinia enterocolitica]HDL7072248.1 replication regulatory protein RepA [Yersinia enterocolitica]
MSQAVNTDTSSSKKRPYRKGNPLTVTERKMASVARKRETHKEISVFVCDPLKNKLTAFCEEDGLTQAQMIETLIEREEIRRSEK